MIYFYHKKLFYSNLFLTLQTYNANLYIIYTDSNQNKKMNGVRNRYSFFIHILKGVRIMKKITVLCLLMFFTFIVSCDYSSYRKNKDQEKEKTEKVTQEKTDGSDTAKEK